MNNDIRKNVGIGPPKPLPFVPPKPPVLQPNIKEILKEKPGILSIQPNPFAPKIKEKEEEEGRSILEGNNSQNKEISTEIPITPIAESQELTSPAVVEVIDQVNASRKVEQSVGEKSPKEGNETEKRDIFNEKVDLSGGLMGWFTKTMAESRLLNDVAEKAKAGMETVMTTLDPGMKPFLADHGVIELTIYGCDADVVGVANESFTKSGTLAITRGVQISETFPPLVFGDENAEKMCAEKADGAKQTKKSSDESAIIVIQPYITEITKRFYYTTKVHFRHEKFQCSAIGQHLEIPQTVMEQLRKCESDGVYSISILEAFSKVFETKKSNQISLFGSAELLTFAFISISKQYESHLARE